MITSRANLAYSASGYCMNPVSDSFLRGKVPPSYISALCDIGDKLVTSKLRHKTCVPMGRPYFGYRDHNFPS